MKKFGMLLALALLFTCMQPVYVLAAQESSDAVYAEDVEVFAEDEIAVASVAGPSGMLSARPEDLEDAVETEDEYLQSESTPTTRLSHYYLDSTYYVYNQIKSYYCGPASVQAVLRYINGSTPTQATVAAALNADTYQGTYMSDIKDYLNEKQSEHTYYVSYSSTLDTLKSKVYSDIVTNDVPLIIGLVFSDDDWLYSTPGHAMSIYGVASDKSVFWLADPWIGYSGSGLSSNSSSYSKSADIVYDAYSTAGAGLSY